MLDKREVWSYTMILDYLCYVDSKMDVEKDLLQMNVPLMYPSYERISYIILN